MSGGMVGTCAVGVIENNKGEILICRTATEQGTALAWYFPRTEIRSGESPEAATRRQAAAQGMGVEVHTAQPPVSYDTPRGKEILRYQFCVLLSGEPTTDGARENRWVLKGQLREYGFADSDAAVVNWLLEE